eukprot:2878350-Pleurochrysis_carterae.AAC.1
MSLALPTAPKPIIDPVPAKPEAAKPADGHAVAACVRRALGNVLRCFAPNDGSEATVPLNHADQTGAAKL